MKKILNINKQRIFVFLFALIFVCSFCFFGFVPRVSAASYEFPLGLLFNETLDIESTEGASFPFTFICRNTTYEALDISLGKMWFSVGSDSLLVYDDGAFLDSGYRYIKALSSSMSLDFLIEAFSNFGKIVKYDVGTKFLFPSVVTSVNFTESLDFVSNGLDFNKITALTFGNPSIVFIDDSSSTMVYETGGWVDESYRNIQLVSSFVPGTLGSYEFFQSALVPPPSFLYRVTSGLSAVIGWVGTVVTSIVSGELVALRPLVAIGIAVSALLLAWVFIRRSIWGR